MSIIRKLIFALLALFVLGGLYLGGAWMHFYGRHLGPGEPTGKRVPETVVAARAAAQREAGRGLDVSEQKQILFGDLHVHSTFSTDAFLWSLPMVQGEGAHPISDACDYARYCSALDFWSINDHAEASTPRRWRETKDAIRECNAVSGDPDNPDVAVFLGFEWSQVGATPAEHYGHKNVIFRGLADDEVAARPIGAAGIATEGLRSSVGQMSPLTALLDFPHRQRYFDFVQFMDEVGAVPRCERGVDTRKLPADCYESAATPAELFEKLDQWNVDALVIPHGNTWGFYSPPGTTWDKQLVGAMHDPDRQFLIEIMSGHGNSEEYRDWRAVRTDDKGIQYCPEPTADYMPSCWRAGQIIYERCMKAGPEAIDLPPLRESYGANLLELECAHRAAEARQNYAEVGIVGSWAIPGVTPEDWLDSGQCRDCFIPAFNYRPGGSTQYALAISNFDDPAHPRRFHFGFIASSDNHSARPGTGYKEFDRLGTTEAGGPINEKWRQRLTAPRGKPEPRSQRVNLDKVRPLGFRALEFERQSSFFMTGGLVAVHAEGRSREQVWKALESKEVYGTSGDRILLWFDLVNPGEGEGAGGKVAMGGGAVMSDNPRFEVRAAGAFKQKPGCPEHSLNNLSHERLEALCKGECYNPSDQRKRITRIEVVRIRPQIRPGEPVRDLIEDPWRTLKCPANGEGCEVEFEDPDYAASGRSAVYYVRAIEEPSPAVNAGGLRCKRDESGNCLEVHPCYGDYRTPASDDCLATIEERAWSSPIYVDPS